MAAFCRFGRREGRFLMLWALDKLVNSWKRGLVPPPPDTSVTLGRLVRENDEEREALHGGF